MTTFTTPASLEPIGAALVTAKEAMTAAQSATAGQLAAAHERVDEALVQLACAACDLVVTWEDESALQPRPSATQRLQDRVTKWRGQFDELRVQVALAELEVKESPHAPVAALEKSAAAVEHLLATTAHDMQSALLAFRDDLRRPRG